MRTAGIRLANAGLFVLACFLLASIANQFAAAGLGAAPLPAAPPATHTAPPRPSWEARSIIIDRNLFGSRGDAEVVVEVVEPVEELEETALPLLLLGTASTEDPTTARAAISNKSRNRYEVVRIGDRLKSHPRVEVLVIEPRRVVLKNGPKREELTLEKRDLAVKKIQPVVAPPKAAAPPPSRSASRSRRAQIARGSLKAPGDAPPRRNAIAENLERLARQVEPTAPPAADILLKAVVQPEYEGTQMVGISLSSIEPGSPLDQLGLEDGDRVSQINGLQLNTPSALQRIAAAISSADRISITVNGEPRVVDTSRIADSQP
ncbi:MAG: type II secretion system protein N [Myxococcota bacterium]|nr:type II secretion system protein N [Myxococcota bacterium]